MEEERLEQKTLESLKGLVPFADKSFLDAVKEGRNIRECAERMKAFPSPRTDIDECLGKVSQEGLHVIGIDHEGKAAVIPSDLASLRIRSAGNDAILDGYMSACRHAIEHILNACKPGTARVTGLSVHVCDDDEGQEVIMDWRHKQDWQLRYRSMGPDGATPEYPDDDIPF